MAAATARRRFRPTLSATVFAIPALAILIGLGTWQLQRLEWKTELLDRIDSRLAAEPAPLPATVDDPDRWDYRPVTLDGRFDHDAELRLVARTLDGAVGVQLITPLIRPDDAEPVLVNRGWAPEADLDAVARPVGPISLTGVAQLPPQRGWLQPDNEPAANQWYWTDPPAMADAAGLDRVAPVIVYAADADPDRLPVGDQVRVDIPNNHLDYALTWYGLAVVLIGVYIAFHWRRP
ncbi:MAG: SURF1 family protein [Alphaproteobacteria bacterium]|jgi:surfeit locus 1 family protein|nr:SURF1 family protein [Alphaproteobacteria bacterium]